MSEDNRQAYVFLFRIVSVNIRMFKAIFNSSMNSKYISLLNRIYFSLQIGLSSRLIKIEQLNMIYFFLSSDSLILLSPCENLICHNIHQEYHIFFYDAKYKETDRVKLHYYCIHNSGCFKFGALDGFAACVLIKWCSGCPGFNVLLKALLNWCPHTY